MVSKFLKPERSVHRNLWDELSKILGAPVPGFSVSPDAVPVIPLGLGEDRIQQAMALEHLGIFETRYYFGTRPNTVALDTLRESIGLDSTGEGSVVVQPEHIMTKPYANWCQQANGGYAYAGALGDSSFADYDFPFSDYPIRHIAGRRIVPPVKVSEWSAPLMDLLSLRVDFAFDIVGARINQNSDFGAGDDIQFYIAGGQARPPRNITGGKGFDVGAPLGLPQRWRMHIQYNLPAVAEGTTLAPYYIKDQVSEFGGRNYMGTSLVYSGRGTSMGFMFGNRNDKYGFGDEFGSEAFSTIHCQYANYDVDRVKEDLRLGPYFGDCPAGKDLLPSMGGRFSMLSGLDAARYPYIMVTARWLGAGYWRHEGGGGPGTVGGDLADWSYPDDYPYKDPARNPYLLGSHDLFRI